MGPASVRPTPKSQLCPRDEQCVFHCSYSLKLSLLPPCRAHVLLFVAAKTITVLVFTCTLLESVLFSLKVHFSRTAPPPLPEPQATMTQLVLTSVTNATLSGNSNGSIDYRNTSVVIVGVVQILMFTGELSFYVYSYWQLRKLKAPTPRSAWSLPMDTLTFSALVVLLPLATLLFGNATSESASTLGKVLQVAINALGYSAKFLGFHSPYLHYARDYYVQRAVFWVTALFFATIATGGCVMMYQAESSPESLTWRSRLALVSECIVGFTLLFLLGCRSFGRPALAAGSGPSHGGQTAAPPRSPSAAGNRGSSSYYLGSSTNPAAEPLLPGPGIDTSGGVLPGAAAGPANYGSTSTAAAAVAPTVTPSRSRAGTADSDFIMIDRECFFLGGSDASMDPDVRNVVRDQLPSFTDPAARVSHHSTEPGHYK